MNRSKGAHRKGLLAAGALSVLFVSVLAFFALRGGASPVRGRADGPPAAPTDLGGAEDGAAFRGSEGQRLQFVDKKDPSRVAAELLASRLDPLPEPKHYAAAEPELWIYSRNGQVVHVRADEGRLYMPDSKAGPESGTIRGHVRVRLFVPEAGGDPVEPDSATPTWTFETDSLAFDAQLGELTTRDGVTVASADTTFEGRGLRVMFSEIDQRVALLEIPGGGTATFRGALPAGSAARGPTPAGPRAAPAPAPPGGAARTTQPSARRPAAPGEARVEQLYHVVFTGDVVASQGERRLDADRLTVWVRLIDNRLPEGAIAPVSIVSVAAAPARPALGPPVALALGAGALGTIRPEEGTSARSAAEPLAAGPGTDEPVSLAWTGPCTIRPIAEAPPELAKNHVYLRATAEKSGLVRFADGGLDIHGHCAMLDYGATSRDLTLSGPGPASVRVEGTGRGVLEIVRAEVSLATGIGHIPGPGLAVGESGEAGAGPARASWTEQADFALRTADGRLTNAVRQATLSGNTELANGRQSLRSGFVRADFEPGEGRPSNLVRLIAEGRVLARSLVGGEELHAEALDIGFAPAPAGRRSADPDPTMLTARGGVLASGQGATLRAEFLEADLARAEAEGDEAGDVVVTRATAREGVRITRADGIEAECDDLEADPIAQIATLLGADTFVARHGTRVEGSQLTLRGLERRLEVFGPGRFGHSEGRDSPGEAGEESPRITAVWSKRMTFDDAVGRIECEGDAGATASRGRLERDTMAAERVEIDLEPLDPDAAPGGEAGRGGDALGALAPALERKILGARAFGSILDRPAGVGGRTASMESRRYGADAGAPDGLRLERLFFVEGPKLLADEVAGTFDVPGAGQMVIVDERENAQAGAPPPTPGGEGAPSAPGGPLTLEPAMARGRTLFEWKGSLHADRGTGAVDLLQGARLTHKDRAGSEAITTRIECERLSAVVAGLRTAGEAMVDGVELVSATARGGVYLRTGTRELAGETIEYDARAGTAEATAAPGAVVTLFDAARATPMTAARLFWNLRTNEFEIRQPGPLVVPR